MMLCTASLSAAPTTAASKAHAEAQARMGSQGLIIEVLVSAAGMVLVFAL
jgi:hypothetical protein